MEDGLEVVFTEASCADFAGVDPDDHVEIGADEHADTNVDEVESVEGCAVLEAGSGGLELGSARSLSGGGALLVLHEGAPVGADDVSPMLPTNELPRVIRRRDEAECDCEDESSVALDAPNSSYASRSASTSAQITNRGSSRGATLSSARSDRRIIVSWGEDMILSSVGSPRYVCRTSNSAVEYRECSVVAARLTGTALGGSGIGGIGETDEADELMGGVLAPGGGVCVRASSESEVPASERRDIRAMRGR